MLEGDGTVPFSLTASGAEAPPEGPCLAGPFFVAVFLAGPVERPRLKLRYDSEVRAHLVESLGLANVMEAPRLEKIVVNMGIGRATQQPETSFQHGFKELLRQTALGLTGYWNVGSPDKQAETIRALFGAGYEGVLVTFFDPFRGVQF